MGVDLGDVPSSAPRPPATGMKGLPEEPGTQQPLGCPSWSRTPRCRFLRHLPHKSSFLPPGVAGVLVGHPFDTVKVSLGTVLFSGSCGGRDMGERPAGSGRPEAPLH